MGLNIDPTTKCDEVAWYHSTIDSLNPHMSTGTYNKLLYEVYFSYHALDHLYPMILSFSYPICKFLMSSFYPLQTYGDS